MKALPVILAAFLIVIPAHAQYSGGTGEQDDPYKIASVEDLMLLSENPEDYDKHFILTADIDLNPNLPGRKVFDKAVIGVDWKTPFTGVFDGNGHTISHLTIAGVRSLGLFGQLGVGGKIFNLGLEAIDVRGTHDSIGGLVGYNHGFASGCYSTGMVSGDDCIGGLVGWNSGTVTTCYSASATGGDENVGGLVGYNSNDVRHCYCTGTVSGETKIGGLVGKNRGDVICCYSIGLVSGQDFVGGLVGTGLCAINSFWDVQTSGRTTSAGGKGRTSDQMKQTSNYVGWNSDGEGIWMIDAGMNYPHLVWEDKGGEFIPASSLGDFLSGNGTQTEPYLIEKAEQFNVVGLYPCEWDKYFLLMSDINLSGQRAGHYDLIGVSSGKAFTGVFDGDGHVIFGFVYVSPSSSSVGVFGHIGTGGIVRNLGAQDVRVSGYSDVGGLVGRNYGVLKDCHSTGVVWGDHHHVGGLVGLGSGVITECYSTGTVSGRLHVGGLIGSSSGAITKCYSTSTVSEGSYLGGLLGSSNGPVTECYSTSMVSGNNVVGGLVGWNRASITTSYSTGMVRGNDTVGGLIGLNRARITSNYSTGTVNGSENVGGLVGKNEDYITHCYSTGAVSGTGGSAGGLVGSGNPDHVTYCFWDTQTSGLAISAGGKGLTTAEMMDPETLGLNGWGKKPNWVLESGRDYPRLVWEGTPGQMIPEPVIAWLNGSGTPTDPFQIENVGQLLTLNEYCFFWDKHFLLMADIDLDPNLPGRSVSAQAVMPIFEGSFDGNDHVILNLHIEGGDSLGLFRRITKDSVIRDLGLENVSVRGTGNNVGGLIGYNRGHVLNCYSCGAILGQDGVGGLIGYNDGNVTHCYSNSAATGNENVGGLMGGSGGAVTACYSTGAVSANSGVGGLVGSNDGHVLNCYNTGAVRGTGWAVGGLVGSNVGDVSNCYSISPIHGGDNVGGLIGSNWGYLSNCYSTGATRGDDNVGGLVGNNYGDVTYCFWDTQTSGQTTSAGGTGLTTAQMQMASTFLDAGWDFVSETANGNDDIWWILEGKDYPRLMRKLSAFSPYPQDGATDVDQPILLRWAPGSSALHHDVYFGEDEQAVANATTESTEIFREQQPTEMTVYDPGILDLSKTYYWRIDEVNEADSNSPWRGKIWSFSTADHTVVLVVDDFERYHDYDTGDGMNIWQVWIDGFGVPTNGSQVGYLLPPYCEQVIVHGGHQSMPLFYNNTDSAMISEAVRTFESPWDWTINDADTLTLYFRGEANNDPDTLYVGIEDSRSGIAMATYPTVDALLTTEWQSWYVSLVDMQSAGVDLTTVLKIYIGVGDRENLQPGGAGKIYIDDIWITDRIP